jgi:hypothetical protein
LCSAGQGHGLHVEQHCKAGDPGIGEPVSGHGLIRWGIGEWWLFSQNRLDK